MNPMESLPKITFFLPSQELVNSVRPGETDFWKWYLKLLPKEGTSRLLANSTWITQTFLKLRDYGFPCELSASLPGEGVIISHSDFFSRLQKPSREQFFVEIKPDRFLKCTFANFVICQNRRDPLFSGRGRGLKRSAVIPLWPQPGLIPRSQGRGDCFENVCYMGRPQESIPQINLLETEIRKLGLKWGIPPRGKWHDYSEIDAVVAIRVRNPQMALRKPASKLINAWAANVPAILSPEPAFENIRKSELDYLKADNIDQVMEQIRVLRDNPSLRKAMVENGNSRSKEYTAEKITQKWEEIIRGPILEEFSKWINYSPSQRRTFFIQGMAQQVIEVSRKRPKLLFSFK